MSEETSVPQEVLDICKQPYARVLLPDVESGRWSAFVMEFPGCLAEGDTPEEAARNLENAMESWVWVTVDQGQSIPSPRLREDYSGKFIVRTSRSLHRQLTAYAAMEGTSLNHFIANTLAKEVGRKELTTQNCHKCKKLLPNKEAFPGKLLRTEGLNIGHYEGLCKTCFKKRQDRLQAGEEDA